MKRNLKKEYAIIGVSIIVVAVLAYFLYFSEIPTEPPLEEELLISQKVYDGHGQFLGGVVGKAGQSFVFTEEERITKVIFNCSASGLTGGTVKCTIYQRDLQGIPTTALAVSNPVLCSQLPIPLPESVVFTFSEPVTASGNLAAILSIDNPIPSNERFGIVANIGGYDGGSILSYDTSWHSSNLDSVFYVYVVK